MGFVQTAQNRVWMVKIDVWNAGIRLLSCKSIWYYFNNSLHTFAIDRWVCLIGGNWSFLLIYCFKFLNFNVRKCWLFSLLSLYYGHSWSRFAGFADLECKAPAFLLRDARYISHDRILHQSYRNRGVTAYGSNCKSKKCKNWETECRRSAFRLRIQILMTWKNL